MIGGIGAQTGYYTLQQAAQAQAANSTSADLFSDASDTDFDAASTGATQSSAASSSASGPTSNLLSSTTLASLLGLQMVNGQADGGASGAQLNLPQTSMSSMDPNALLNTQTLQMLQSIGA